MAEAKRGVTSLVQFGGTRPDGSQVLLDVWLRYSEGGMLIEGVDLAERPERGDVWGPPMELERGGV